MHQISPLASVLLGQQLRVELPEVSINVSSVNRCKAHHLHDKYNMNPQKFSKQDVDRMSFSVALSMLLETGPHSQWKHCIDRGQGLPEEPNEAASR